MSIEKENIRIIVVDDEEVILNVFASMLRQNKYHADFFPSSQKAFKAIETRPERYDLLISDIYMADGYGVDFAKKVRAVAPHLPIMFMTGNASEELKEQALKLGRVAFLSKPFPLMEHLEQTISKFLAEK